MYNDDNFVRMEKKATNKVGLFILFLIIIAGIGGGIYYYLNNKNSIKIDFSLPWEKNEQEEKNQKQSDLNIERQSLEISTEKVFNANELIIVPSILDFDEATGYKLTLDFSNPSSSYVNGTINNVLIENYQLDYNLSFNLNPLENKTFYIDIPVEFLDKYFIETFSSIILKIDVYVAGENKYPNWSVPINTNAQESLTQLKDLSPLGNTEDVYIKYHNITSDDEYYYINLLFENKSATKEYSLLVQNILINDKIYDVSSFNTIVKTEAKKIDSIKIPKKDYKRISNVTISFFAINNNDIYTIRENTIKNVTNS